MKRILFIAIPLILGCSSVKKEGTPNIDDDSVKLHMTGIMDTITVSINGHIIDANGRIPLNQITIFLENKVPNQGSFTSHSNKAGLFSFKHIPAGIYKIKVDGLGYYSKDTNITMESGSIWEWEFQMSKWSQKTVQEKSF